MTGGITLGRIVGVPVRLSGSWFLLSLVIVVGYGGHLSRAFPWLGVGGYLAALGFALLLAVSVGLHELAHALSARALGWEVSQITLSLMGGHTSFTATRPTPGRSALVSLAGPLGNLCLAGLGAALQAALHPTGAPALVLYLVTSANLLVGLFNLLPGLPLDGGHAVAALVWKATGSRRTGTVVAGWLGIVVAAGIVCWVLFSGAYHSLTSVVVSAMLVFFLYQGASASLRGERFRGRIEALSAKDLSRPALRLPATASVAQALEGLAAERARRGDRTLAVVLDPYGAPLGLVDEAAARSVPDPRRDATPATATMRRVPFGPPVDAGLSGEALVGLASRNPGAGWPVLAHQAPGPSARPPHSPDSDPAAAQPPWLGLLLEEDVRHALHTER